MDPLVAAALIAAVPVTLGTIWGAIKGIAVTLRWWAEREEARITRDLLGKQAIETVETKNQELTTAHQTIAAMTAELAEVKQQLQACLSSRGGATQ